MRCDANGFSLRRVQVESIEDKAKKHLDIIDRNARMFPVRGSRPLEQISLRLKLLIFCIGSGGRDNWNFAVGLFQHRFDLTHEPEAFFTEGKELPLLLTFGSLVKKVL